MGGKEETERALRFQGTKFLVIPAVLTLIRLLSDYVQLCQEWSSCADAIIERMVDLLRFFNQQAYKLVLGGQAVQLKLKKINATHLALVCQCCALVEHVVPIMQEHLLEVLVDCAETTKERV